MRFWLTSVLVLFGMVELYQWMKPFTVPLPVFILAGVFLAIASNYGKYSGWPFQQTPTPSDSNRVSTSIEEKLTKPRNWANLNQSATQPLPQATRSISFTIHRHLPEQTRNDHL
ncbi:MAG: hypothetical protein AB1589_30680 [Cyanobacteriota bacterium]